MRTLGVGQDDDPETILASSEVRSKWQQAVGSKVLEPHNMGLLAQVNNKVLLVRNKVLVVRNKVLVVRNKVLVVDSKAEELAGSK